MPGAGGGGGDNTTQISGGEGPPPPYRSEESTPGQPPRRSRSRLADMDTADDMGLGPDTDPSGSGGPLDCGPPALRGRRLPRELPGNGQPGEPPNRGPPDRGPSGGQPGGNPPDKPRGWAIPENIWRWIVFLKRKIWKSEREAQINKMETGKSTAVAANTHKELDIATFEARKLSGMVTKLQRRLDRLEDPRSNRKQPAAPSGAGLRRQLWARD